MVIYLVIEIMFSVTTAIALGISSQKHSWLCPVKRVDY